MTDTYISDINQKREKENIKREVMFGQGLGIILTITAFLTFLSTTNKTTEEAMKVCMIIGSILLITGIVFPYILYYPSKWIKKIINSMFLLLLSCILIISYFLFVIPVRIINRKKWKEKYEFFYWNEEFKQPEKGFIPIADTINLQENSNNGSNRLKSILKVMGYFMEKKQYILIPILCILIAAGLLFFFLTSSVVTPMIYTLF